MRQLRRRATMLLHWTLFVQIWTLALAGRTGDRPLPDWFEAGYAIVGLMFVGLAVVFGMMNKPGPKLTGWVRGVHPWAHRALYALVAWSAVAFGAEALGRPIPGPQGSDMVPAVLAATILHAVYHMWRHTTLMDGALRMITPKAVHHIL